jgi:hypothetical protein
VREMRSDGGGRYRGEYPRIGKFEFPIAVSVATMAVQPESGWPMMSLRLKNAIRLRLEPGDAELD